MAACFVCANAAGGPQTPPPVKRQPTDTPEQMRVQEARWEDPDGFVGRYQSADGQWTVDVAVDYWKHAFYAKLRTGPTGEPPTALTADNFADARVLVISGADISGRLQNGKMTLNLPSAKDVELRRVPVGKTDFNPPAGAEVLLNAASGMKHFSNKDGGDPAWLVLPGGVIESAPNRGSLYTRGRYEDAVLYFEFREPYNSREAGNSGAYLHSAYETQVIDSFGWDLVENMCGTPYRIQAPKKNMSAPPLEWQSMKIDFTAPRFDAQGKKIQNARESVWLNGEQVADNVEVPHHTIKAYMPEPVGPQPIYFQEHHSAVQYRNIWVLKK